MIDMDNGDRLNRANRGVKLSVESDIVYEAYPNEYRVSLCTYMPQY